MNKPRKKRTASGLGHRIRHYFTRIPLPQTACHISSRYLSAVHFSAKEKNPQLKSHFILPLPTGVIDPHFYKTNIKDPAELEKLLKAGLARIKGSGHNIVFLLPEASQKIFIFPLDSLPSSPPERDRFIRFRVEKQMPLLPEDSRLDFAWIRSNGVRKIVVTLARASVIREYEDFLHKHHLKVRVVGIPSLGSFNLINRAQERDFIFIDVEDTGFTLMAAAESQLTLYRQKALAPGDLEGNVETIAQEVINTTNFIEDNEKRKISTLWARFGLLDTAEEIEARLEGKLGITLKPLEDSVPVSLPDREKSILAALIGYIQ